ncbi:MAG: LacI family DNA-binding transcriptional regulator [Victivallales bacterium]
MAVTLKDVAALVGVSVNTVSLALKDKPEIKLKTRERVKAAAEALGYRPT